MQGICNSDMYITERVGAAVKALLFGRRSFRTSAGTTIILTEGFRGFLQLILTNVGMQSRCSQRLFPFNTFQIHLYVSYCDNFARSKKCEANTDSRC
jgi:hypothetical protein